MILINTHTKRIITVLCTLFFATCATTMHAAKLTEWEAEYRKGAGLSLTSPDGEFRFRQLGYLQFRSDVYHSDFQRAARQGAFGMRRARLDWIIDIEERYQMLIEVDGADFNGTNQSDFDLVVAKISGPSYWGGRWSAGKFITPFSTENNRSSRSLDMIERYLALNSLFLLPALDVQFGGMLEQPLGQGWTLYTGLFNGNGRAADNLSENNGSKEFQMKLQQDVSEEFQWSIALDRSSERPQTLSLEGYTFTNYASLGVTGTRRLYGASFDYTGDEFSLRGEGLHADFRDASTRLNGAYLQPGYFLEGDRSDGLQALLRFDYARMNQTSDYSIAAVTGGLNWYVNPNVRLKTNLVAEYYADPGNNVTSTNGVHGDGIKNYLITELQMKF
ncbi:MAG: porin [bacterium]